MDMLDLEKVFNTDDVIVSICNWNEARYKQEYDHTLTMALLDEEFTEVNAAIAANDLVEILDGLGDMFYVVIGAIWKAGATPQDIKNLLDDMDRAPVPTISATFNWLKVRQSLSALAIVALSAFQSLASQLNSKDAAMDIIRAICKSNNTKVVVKTANDVKANLVKGDDYISPTEDIKQIITKYLGGLSVN